MAKMEDVKIREVKKILLMADRMDLFKIKLGYFSTVEKCESWHLILHIYWHIIILKRIKNKIRLMKTFVNFLYIIIT